jgi:hypothetical protein
MALSLVGKGIRALQKGRVQKKLKKAERGKRSPIKRDDQYTEQLAKDKHAKQQAKIQEAQAGAKKAERGVQPTKAATLEKKVLPEVSGVRAKLKGMSAQDISEKYTGKEISSMQRKIKDPRILARLQRARKMREKGHREWETYEKGEKHTPGQKLRFKFDKSGGTLKRKSGGKVKTDGNAYVAALYKGGKVGG